jgi:hypothetical protein
MRGDWPDPLEILELLPEMARCLIALQERKETHARGLRLLTIRLSRRPPCPALCHPMDRSTDRRHLKGKAERSKAMSYSISTLLTRNLHDVFGENDGTRRRAAIDEIYTEDCVFYDPTKGVYRGRDEIDRVAGKIKATHPDFRYQPIVGPEELGNGGRIQWVSGRPGEAPAYAGTDFIIVRDGRIAALYLFFDKLP